MLMECTPGAVVKSAVKDVQVTVETLSPSLPATKGISPSKTGTVHRSSEYDHSTQLPPLILAPEKYGLTGKTVWQKPAWSPVSDLEPTHPSASPVLRTPANHGTVFVSNPALGIKLLGLCFAQPQMWLVRSQIGLVARQLALLVH